MNTTAPLMPRSDELDCESEQSFRAEDKSQQEQLPSLEKTCEKADNEQSHKSSDDKKTPGKPGPPPRRLVIALTIVLCVLGAIAGYPSLREFLTTEQTDDAYITGHVHPVSSKIAGTINSVVVKDNQWVEKGQLLATIDSRDVQIELAKAEAHLSKVERDATAAKHVVLYAVRNKSAVDENAAGSIAQAEHSITKAESGIKAAQSDVALAKQELIEREAKLHKAKLDLDRYTALAQEGAVTLDRLDEARKEYDVAVAAKDAAEESVGQSDSRVKQAYADLKISQSQLVNAKSIALQAQAADAQISVNAEQEASTRAEINEARADVQNARLRLSYTKIVAPVSGRVGKKSIEEGQRIQPGTPLLALVSRDKWIVANYKETQLKDMRVGDAVKIKVDAFGDHEFAGRVESFSPASGASFALLPPDNATGNFTKIVQRIPVKIVFEKNSLGEFERLIVPGMSCDVKVKVR